LELTYMGLGRSGAGSRTRVLTGVRDSLI